MWPKINVTMHQVKRLYFIFNWPLLKQIALGSICRLEKPLLSSTKTKSQSHQSPCQSRVTSPTHSQGLYVLFCFRSAFICCIFKKMYLHWNKAINNYSFFKATERNPYQLRGQSSTRHPAHYHRLNLPCHHSPRSVHRPPILNLPVPRWMILSRN